MWLCASNTSIVRMGITSVWLMVFSEFINGSPFATYRSVPSSDGLLRSTNIELVLVLNNGQQLQQK